MSEQKKKTSGLVKTILFSTLFLGGVVLGDQTQPLTKTINEISYHNISPEDGTPRDFQNYESKIVLNEKGRAELYFGNKETGEYKKVHEDGTVGSLGQKIDDYFDRKKVQFQEWYDGLKKTEK